MSPSRRALLSLSLLALVVGAMAPSVAPAAVRLASPTSVDTAGACLITACRLDRALAVAQAGDEVALEDGVPYAVSWPLQATDAVIIRPATPGTQPRLVGGAGLATPTLKLAAGGTVSGLRIETAVGQPALHLAGGARGIALELFASSANSATKAAWLDSAPGGTALINTFARSSGSTVVEAGDGATPGGVSFVNLTAISTGGSNAWGVTTDLATQSPVVRNSIVRAPSKNFHGRAGSTNSQPILVSNSNFVVGTSSGFTDVANNQKSAAVTFADEAGGDYRPTSGAPTIDAGAADALIAATVDPDGRARSLGAAPDIGAYEYGGAASPAPTPAGATGTGGTTSGGTTTDAAATPDSTIPTTSYVAPDGTPVLVPASAPVLGTAVTVDAAQGTPLIRLPGARRFVRLSEATSIPVGSVIDATDSQIRLTSVRDDRGRTQTGEFWGGRFAVRQPKGKAPYTDLVLTGSSFARCPKAAPRARHATAFAAAATRRKRAVGKKTVVRSLWGRDHKGKFRTRGRNSVATVRGTVWLVQDRCDGTLTRVTKGAVDVRETRGRTVRLRAGRSHLARR